MKEMMMQTENYYPKLGEATPTNVDGYLKPCLYAGKIRVWTMKDLSGQGIKHVRTFEPKDLTDRAQQWVGFREYIITSNAAKKLNMTFANECSLE